MQTSIEWFIEHLLGSGLLRLTKDDHNLYSKLRDEAKEMHKQEIIDAYVKGYVEDIPNPIKSEYYIANGEQYYQETFKKD
jgi:hypothetical protein